jgi:hypothetical protein
VEPTPFGVVKRTTIWTVVLVVAKLGLWTTILYLLYDINDVRESFRKSSIDRRMALDIIAVEM